MTNALLGFPDAICKIPELIQKAYDLQLNGITITEHEGLSSHIQALNYYKSMQKDRPFILGLGNEIYLVTEEEDIENKENPGTHPYYHFILTALDTQGHKQLRQLSTRAWKRAWQQGTNWRKPTYYSDLEEIIKPNQGHIIVSTACLGSRIDRLLLNNQWEKVVGKNGELNKLLGIFGANNLYLEIQPAKDNQCDQFKVNELLWKVHEFTKIKIIPTTDSHYLSKKDAFIHKIYLQSQDGDREVDDFYTTAFLMSPNELREYLLLNFNSEQIDQMFEWSNEIGNRIQEYNIYHNPIIPKIPDDKLPNFVVKHRYKNWYTKYPNFGYYSNSQLSQHEQYFFYRIEKGLEEKIENKGLEIETYIKRLDEECEQFKLISDALGTCLPNYFTSMSKIIDLIWEADSLAMPGRGSSAACLCNYLLDVTQINPVPLGEYYPFWRFLNLSRGAELPD